jgi:hypothetical protein
LKEIHTQQPTPVSISNIYVFYNVNKNTCKLYVPKGSYNAYRTATHWRDFVNIIEEDATAINLISEDKIVVYPNPVKHELFIKSKSPIEKVEIYNQSGQVVLKETNFSEKIDVSRLADGIYFVRITVDGTVVTKKIVVK